MDGSHHHHQQCKVRLGATGDRDRDSLADTSKSSSAARTRHLMQHHWWFHFCTASSQLLLALLCKSFVDFIVKTWLPFFCSKHAYGHTYARCFRSSSSNSGGSSYRAIVIGLLAYVRSNWPNTAGVCICVYVHSWRHVAILIAQSTWVLCLFVLNVSVLAVVAVVAALLIGHVRFLDW